MEVPFLPLSVCLSVSKNMTKYLEIKWRGVSGLGNINGHQRLLAYENLSKPCPHAHEVGALCVLGHKWASPVLPSGSCHTG